MNSLNKWSCISVSPLNPDWDLGGQRQRVLRWGLGRDEGEVAGGWCVGPCYINPLRLVLLNSPWSIFKSFASKCH